MSMDDIRNTYGVPAKRGMRVRYTDQSGAIWNGRITSARNQYLRVLVDDRVDGYRGRLLLHPTWRVEYLKVPHAQLSGPSRPQRSHDEH